LSRSLSRFSGGPAHNFADKQVGYAMLGSKEPQAAMSEVKKRVQPLLPT